MNEEHLNLQIRKFLKKVGIQSQREIEDALRRAIAEGVAVQGRELPVHMHLGIPEIGLDVTMEGSISLE